VRRGGRGRRGLGGHSRGGVLAVTWEVVPTVGRVVYVVGRRGVGMGMGVGVGVGVVDIVLGKVGVDHDHRYKVDKIGMLQFDVHFECIFGPIHLVTRSY
jgi:hypothetical protein